MYPSREGCKVDQVMIVAGIYCVMRFGSLPCLLQTELSCRKEVWSWGDRFVLLVHNITLGAVVILLSTGGKFRHVAALTPPRSVMLQQVICHFPLCVRCDVFCHWEQISAAKTDCDQKRRCFQHTQTNATAVFCSAVWCLWSLNNIFCMEDLYF